MKNKKIVVVILILLISIFLSNSQTTPPAPSEPPSDIPPPAPIDFGKGPDAEEKKILYEMGFDVAKDKDDKGITPEDIKVSEDKKTITITEAGVKKEIDVSKLKGKIIIKIPFGGRFRDKRSSLIEDIEFDIDNDNAPKKIKDDDKKTSNVYYFSKEQQEIIVIDGAVQLKKVKLEKGSRISGASIEGSIEEYNLEIQKLSSKKGSSIKIHGYEIIPSNNQQVIIEGNDIIAEEEVVIKDKNGNYFGKLKGRAKIHDSENMVLLLMARDYSGISRVHDVYKEFPKETTFVNYKGTVIKTNEFLFVGKGKIKDVTYIKNEMEIFPLVKERSIKAAYDRIEYNGDLIVIPFDMSEGGGPAGPMGKEGEETEEAEEEITRKIEITTKDKDYENIITKTIQGNLEVDLNVLRKVDNKEIATKFIFSKNPPIVQGSFEALNTNIGHTLVKKNGEVSKLLPWIIFKGEKINEDKIGEIKIRDPLSNLEKIEDTTLKKLFISSINFGQIDVVDITKNFKESLRKYLSNDKELQIEFAKVLPELGYSGVLLAEDLLEISKNNPEAQKNILRNIDELALGEIPLEKLFSLTENNKELYGLLLEIYPKGIKPEVLREVMDDLKNLKNFDEIQELLLQKTDGLFYPEKLKELSFEEKKQLLKKTTFFSGESAKIALEDIGGNKELQDIVLNNLKLTFEERDRTDTFAQLLELTSNNPEAEKKLIERYSKNIFYNENIRKYIIGAEPERVSRILALAHEYYAKGGHPSPERYVTSPGWEPEMSQIYTDKKFLEKTKNLENVERWSIGLSAVRRLEQKGEPLNSENIGKAVDEIISLRAQHKDRVILGPEHNFIPITNDGPEFDQDELFELARDSGVKEDNIAKGLRGALKKQDILDSIKNSKGPTTVLFNNHGSPKNQLLGRGALDIENEALNDPKAISYQELGNMLIERAKNGQSLSDVNIMFDSCFSHDYTEKLYSYLRENGKSIIRDLPVVVTETNRGQVGYGAFRDSQKESGVHSPFNYGLIKTKEKGKPLTLGDVFKSEKYYFAEEDGAVFVPVGKEVISIGSSRDDLEPDKNPNTPPQTEKKEDLPIIIEIGKVEDKIQRELVA